MSKKLTILILITFFVIGASWFSKNKKPFGSEEIIKNNNKVTLFVSLTCSHCKAVEKWLDSQPGIKEKSRLETKEVYQNKNNRSELGERAAECQIDERNGIGVPFLYDNGECVVGDQPIIDYLKEKYQ